MTPDASIDQHADDVRILLDFFEELSHVEIHWAKSRMVEAETAVARLRRELIDGGEGGS